MPTCRPRAPHLQLGERHAVRGAGRVVDERHLAEEAARLEDLHPSLLTLQATAWFSMVPISPSEPSALVQSVCPGSCKPNCSKLEHPAISQSPSDPDLGNMSCLVR